MKAPASNMQPNQKTDASETRIGAPSASMPSTIKAMPKTRNQPQFLRAVSMPASNG